MYLFRQLSSFNFTFDWKVQNLYLKWFPQRLVKLFLFINMKDILVLTNIMNIWGASFNRKPLMHLTLKVAWSKPVQHVMFHLYCPVYTTKWRVDPARCMQQMYTWQYNSGCFKSDHKIMRNSSVSQKSWIHTYLLSSTLFKESDRQCIDKLWGF